MSWRPTCCVVAIALLALIPAVAKAQADELQINEVNDDDYPTVEVLVTVPESLADVRLSNEPFSIREGDGPSISPYLGATPEGQDPPAPHVVLAIDTSESMRTSIDEARQAADNFVNSLPTGSEVGVITFGDDVNVRVESTTDLAAVRSTIAAVRVDPGAHTALNEGVRKAASLLAVGTGERGNVVLLSDGQNSVGGTSRAAAIDELAKQDVRLWAVALPGEENQAALDALAGDDGRVLPADNADDLDGIYQDLATDLARQYVLRYESQADGRTDIGVRLDLDTMSVEQTRTVTIDAAGLQASNPSPVTAVSAKRFVVTVPLLGTVGAYVVGLTALSAGALVLLLFLLLPRVRRPRERLTIDRQQRQRPSSTLASLAQWTADATEQRLRRGTLGARLDRELEAAGLNVRPGEFIVTAVCAVLVVYALGVLAGSPLFGLLLAVTVPLAIRLWLAMRRDRRQTRFGEQLTDVLQLIGSSLRAGYGLTQGIDAVSRDAEEPAASEFRRIIIEHRLGRDLNEAMDNCATRMNNADFSWVVQAIGIHRDVGGDLAKVLDNIVATIRDRADVHRQVRSLSAEGRLSARVLIAMPILVLVALLFMSPGYLSPLWTNPIGWVLLAGGALLMIVGMLVIRRMANIQY